MSRRRLFQALTRPSEQLQENTDFYTPVGPPTRVTDEESGPVKAIIQGRFCLAYQGGTCFTCSERCPEPGAITMDKGIPIVHADKCTGCRICYDLCPAPRNAILLQAVAVPEEISLDH